MPILLFLDDTPERIPLLRPEEIVHYVRNAKEFVDWLENNPMPDVISFDHDLANEHYENLGGYNAHSPIETGDDCAKWCILTGRIPTQVIVHSWNVSGALRIATRFTDIGHKNVSIRKFNPKIPHLW